MLVTPFSPCVLALFTYAADTYFFTTMLDRPITLITLSDTTIELKIE